MPKPEMVLASPNSSRALRPPPRQAEDVEGRGFVIAETRRLRCRQGVTRGLIRQGTKQIAQRRSAEAQFGNGQPRVTQRAKRDHAVFRLVVFSLGANRPKLT